MRRGAAGAAVVMLVLSVVTAGAAAWGQEKARMPEPAVKPKDIFDVLRELFHKPVKEAPESQMKSVGKAMYAYAPYIAANSTNGFMVGAGGNVAFYRGDPKTTNLSTAVASLSLTSKGQLFLSTRLATFSRNNTWYLYGDNRLALTREQTYGLGADTPASARVDAKFDFFRVYDTVYRRLFPRFYAGAGFFFDAHSKVRAAPDSESVWSESPYVTYSERNGFNLNSQNSAGVGVSALFDSRDNPIDPDRGAYANLAYRFFFKGFLGGASAWEELQYDLRTYLRLSEDSRHKLAFWLYGDLVTKGKGPYFDLPATGMDTYGRTGRGFIQGRFRGEEMVYGELEYRWTITRNGLFGMVAFVNTETLSNKQTGERLFDSFASAVGLGLRVRLNKDSRTNLCVDFGVGEKGSTGFFMGVQEAF